MVVNDIPFVMSLGNIRYFAELWNSQLTPLHVAPTRYFHSVMTPAAVKERSLRWLHNGRDGVSNHQPHDCLLNRLFRRRSKKTSKLRVTGHCVGNSPVTGEFPAQMASYAEILSISWRHHVLFLVVRRLHRNIISMPRIERLICDQFSNYKIIDELYQLFFKEHMCCEGKWLTSVLNIQR